MMTTRNLWKNVDTSQLSKESVERFMESCGASEAEMQNASALFDATPASERPQMFEALRARMASKGSGSNKMLTGGRGKAIPKPPAPERPVIRPLPETILAPSSGYVEVSGH